ncbi:MAG: signal peptide peptidase SppA [Candidatus Nanohalobium sp.]
MKKKLVVLAGLILVLTASATAFSFSDMFGTETGKVALVQLSGTITPSSSGFSTGGITPSKVRELNRKVESGNYDAVIYEINSGGGAVVASKEIKRSIEKVSVPTVCRFRDVSASGAYLISTGCDKIVADSATMTGSIGVTSSYLSFSEAIENYGIDYINISAGKYKEMGSRFSNMSEKEKKIMENMAENIQEEFISIVDKSRNLTSKEEKKIETARIFLGDEAKNLSLVDKLGGRSTAIEVAEELSGKDELKVEKVETVQEFNLMSMFLSETGIKAFLDIFSAQGVEVPLKAEL